MGCCCFFLLTQFIYSIIFGKLRKVEHQHMRDKFWNFVFYKFIFVFGVMNVQEIPEMLLDYQVADLSDAVHDDWVDEERVLEFASRVVAQVTQTVSTDGMVNPS